MVMFTNHLISGPIGGEYYLCGQELHLPEADLLVQQEAAQLHPWSQQSAEVLPVDFILTWLPEYPYEAILGDDCQQLFQA